MKKRKSIHDIAKELKISATTISFVLNGKAAEKRISSDVQERVRAYVTETGYQPSLLAKSLRTGKTKIVGMLVEDISDPFFSSIARGIEESLYKKGYKIFYSSTENKPEKAKELINIFRERQVDAYIIAPTPGLENEVKALIKENQPVVLFDRYYPELATHNIVVDNYGGAVLAVDHFLKNSFKKIAMVTLESEQVQMMGRLDGYRNRINENGLKPLVLQIPYNLDTNTMAEKVKSFLKKNKSIDAILFATNYLAIAGMHAMKELELRIPEDIAIIGFDDNTHFALFSPSVTAVAQPISKIAESISDALTRHLDSEDNKNPPHTEVLPVELIIRQSSQLPNS